MEPGLPPGPAGLPGQPGDQGLQAIMAGLTQGGVPDAQLGKTTLPLMGGSQDMAQVMQNLSPAQMQALTQMIVSALGGQGAATIGSLPTQGTQMPGAIPGMPNG